MPIFKHEIGNICKDIKAKMRSQLFFFRSAPFLPLLISYNECRDSVSVGKIGC